MDAWWLLVPAAYVLGVVPTAQIVAGWFGHDPTLEGSGNPGASNVYRVAGRAAGATVLTGDILKGFVPALVGLVAGGRALALACGLAAMLGHIAPVTRRFRGGKGVATLGGAAWVLYPLVCVGLIACWVIVMKIFRRASIGSLVMALLLPVGVAARGRPWWEVLAIAVAAGIIVARHRSNIARLLHRREHAISE